MIHAVKQDETKDLINEFIKRQTKGLIPQLIEKPLASDTLLALVNALYFRGSWQKPMEKVNLTISFNGGAR